MNKATLVNRKAINKNGTIKFVPVQELQHWIDGGWVLGKGKKSWNSGLKGCTVAWNKGQHISQETRDKISKRLTGRKLSEEHIKNRTIAQTGLTRSQEFKESQRQQALGHKLSEEAKQKISLKNKGKSHSCSEETKLKISKHNSSTEFQEHQREVKTRNNSFNKSNGEDVANELLISHFGENNVIRHYTDERYPFECDFYIKSLDMFIELNYHFTHGPHPFNASNKADVDLLNKLKLKPQTRINSKGKIVKSFYAVEIDIWTDRDQKKIETAIKNNLNYKMFYTTKDFMTWLNNFIEEN